MAATVVECVDVLSHPRNSPPGPIMTSSPTTAAPAISAPFAPLDIPPDGGGWGGGAHVSAGGTAGAWSGGYHLPSEATHHPGPCETSLTPPTLRCRRADP